MVVERSAKQANCVGMRPRGTTRVWILLVAARRGPRCLRFRVDGLAVVHAL
jgi:hypothetical protein